VAFAATVAVAPLTLSLTTRPVPVSGPLMVPPTVYVLVTQAIETLVIFAPATVPVPLVTVHTCVGLLGCVPTVTVYWVPLGNVANV